jgi:hypothetical protein
MRVGCPGGISNTKLAAISGVAPSFRTSATLCVKDAVRAAYAGGEECIDNSDQNWKPEAIPPWMKDPDKKRQQRVAD